MNRFLIEKLSKHNSFPAVSILLPTHRTHPDNKQDPIALKNLVREVEDRILQEESKRGAEPLLTKIAEIVEAVDHEHNLDGLAIFVGDGVSEVVKLPFQVPARAQIDETFAVRDLMYAYNRTPHYYVLVLSEKPTRLFNCFKEHAEEVKVGKFPMEHGGPGGASGLDGGVGQNRSKQRDLARKAFVRSVGEELEEVMKLEELPLVVTGTEDFLADFKAETKFGDRLVAEVAGSYDYASPHELTQVVWPAVKDGFDNRRSSSMDTLGTAVGASKAASGLVQVYDAAREGRIDLILVEEDYRQPARLDSSGAIVDFVDDVTLPDAQDDLVDLAISEVVRHNGSVVFTDPGVLEGYDHIAATLRY